MARISTVVSGSGGLHQCVWVFFVTIRFGFISLIRALLPVGSQKEDGVHATRLYRVEPPARRSVSKMG